MHHASVYSPREEQINIVLHAAGLIGSVIALLPLIFRAAELGGFAPMFSFSVFGASLIVLFAASTIYHTATDPVLRSRLRIVDHASIYLLIAGTYTPFTLITLDGSIGRVLFCIAWGLALTGIVLKLFFTGRYNRISTLMYLLMGWIIVFAIKPLIANLPPAGLLWLVLGGAAYTLGAILYSIRRIPFNHAIFHVFVLLGASCHFMAIYFHV
ncbi:MAG TPA: hemolysin III family protein [Woeseiaceae bacterium]|nr:hemolysin III family protein [Woeseiaceae bacterium]